MNLRTINQSGLGTVTLQQTEQDGILFVTFAVDYPTPTVPQPITLAWDFPATDCFGTWHPMWDNIHALNAAFNKRTMPSRLAAWLPVQSVYNLAGQNRLLVAVADVDTPLRIRSGMVEETAALDCKVEFFTTPIAATTHYETTLRLDTRPVPYEDAIYDTVRWWETDCGYRAAPVPDAARLPMDSLWYSFHQQLDREEILRECRASRPLGMRTVIIDDGWQTDDNNRGYAYCGDWEVASKKMGDMASLVEELHAIDMKVMLWYSVPFVGIHSQAYTQFKDCFLDGCGMGSNTFVLDPRYPAVRTYLANTYKKAVADWKLDGLKLDFIDSFELKGKSLEPDPRRDFTSLEDALHALLGEVRESLVAINPDILIEFRQAYIGPSIRRYGNMLRVGDCPADTLKNRLGAVSMRLTSGHTAVHSDMLMWHPDDTPENAALQLVNVLCAVPQISMRVDELPPAHYAMLKYYLAFWEEYREVLLDGKLTAQNPAAEYSQICMTKDDTAVFVTFSQPLVNVTTAKAVVVNGSAADTLIIADADGIPYRTVNCQGKTLDSGVVCGNLAAVAVPTSGMIFLG